MPYMYLFLAFSLNAFANILLKLGARNGFDTSSLSPFALAGNNWLFGLGLLLFASNVVFYFFALRELPLSVAYPIMVVMSFAIVNGYAFFGLGEEITALQVLGYAAIVGGLILVVSQQ